MATRQEWITQKELAERLLVSVKTVQRWTDGKDAFLVPRIPKKGRKVARYPWPRSRTLWRKHEEAKLRRKILKELGNPSDPARRKLEAEATTAELRLAELEGKLIPLEVLDDVVSELLDRLQSVVLNVPGSWAPHLLKIKNRRVATVRLRKLMGELLDALAAVSEDFEE